MGAESRKPVQVEGTGCSLAEKEHDPGNANLPKHSRHGI